MLCGDVPPMKGRIVCATCSNLNSRTKQKTRARRHDRGLCVICGGSQPGELKTCRACLESAAATVKKLYLRRKAANICVTCGKQPSKPNRVKCVDCLQHNQARQVEPVLVSVA